MTESEELAKARLHNAQSRNRAMFQRALRRRLSGSKAARDAVVLGFAPVVKASQETREAGGDPC